MQNKKVEETKIKLSRELGDVEVEREYNPSLDNRVKAPRLLSNCCGAEIRESYNGYICTKCLKEVVDNTAHYERTFTSSEVEEIKKEERRKVLKEGNTKKSKLTREDYQTLHGLVIGRINRLKSEGYASTGDEELRDKVYDTYKYMHYTK